MSNKKMITKPEGPFPEVPPKLFEEIRNVKNDTLSASIIQKLKSFCDVQTFVNFDGTEVPVLKPNLGFMPTGEFEEFMDFDYFVEDAGLRKFVRTRFDDEHFKTSHVAISVVKPGVRAREGANLFKLDSN
jgi:hypothetical protein